MPADARKLEAIRKLAEGMQTNQDEYAVGLASAVLAVIDGTVTDDQILAHCSNRRGAGGEWIIGKGTVGEALTAAKAHQQADPGVVDGS